MASRTRNRDSRRRIKGSAADLVCDVKTSKRMGNIRQKDTGPELDVRRVLKRLGHHYRIENRDLPGSPDIANRARRWAIFVHGCFWHRHRDCPKTTTPKRNRRFWTSKFAQNVLRDRRALRALSQMGFLTIVVWECQAKSQAILRRTLEVLTQAGAGEWHRPASTAQHSQSAVGTHRV